MKIASLKYSAVEQELFPLATQASEYMDRLFPAGKLAEVKSFLLRLYTPWTFSGIPNSIMCM